MTLELTNNTAELLFAVTRVTYLLIDVAEPITLSDICIDKGDGWMPYNGSIKINGIAVQFPANLSQGENFITLIEPYEGSGIYLKGYDFLNVIEMKIVSSIQVSGAISGDNSRSGELIITAPGIITINFADITTTNYNVVALITTTDGSIGIADILFNTRTNTSVQAQAYEAGIMRYVITPHK